MTNLHHPPPGCTVREDFRKLSINVLQLPLNAMFLYIAVKDNIPVCIIYYLSTLCMLYGCV